MLRHYSFSDRKSACRGGCPLQVYTNNFLSVRDTAMPGLTETLVIIAIILAIFVLPGRFGKRKKPVKRLQNLVCKITIWQCTAFLVSILWLAALALYLKPWNKGWDIFIYAGAGPVVLYWGIYMAFINLRKKRR